MSMAPKVIRGARPFLFRAQQSKTSRTSSKKGAENLSDRTPEDRGDNDNDEWILDLKRDTRIWGDVHQNYLEEHPVNLRLLSRLYRIATEDPIARILIRILQEQAITNNMQIFVGDAIIQNVAPFFVQFFEGEYTTFLRDAILMQVTLGLVIVAFLVDKDTDVVIPYIPRYGRYKVSVIDEDGVQKYVVYEIETTKNDQVEWVRNSKVLVFDHFDTLSRPSMDGGLNSPMLSIARTMSYLEHMLESVAIADELNSRPLTFVGVEPAPSQPIDAGSSQSAVFFQDADMRDIMNIGMSVPLSAYPASQHAQRLLAQDMAFGASLQQQLRAMDAQNLQSVLSNRTEQAISGAYQTSFLLPPHIGVQRLPVPPHPGHHFERVNYYIAVIANTFNIPQDMLMPVNMSHGLQGSTDSQLGYELGLARFNATIRSWSHFLMGVLNAANSRVMYLNGYGSTLKALLQKKNHHQLEKGEEMFDLRVNWIQKLASHAAGPAKMVLSDPVDATEYEIMAYLYAGKDKGALRLHFPSAPATVDMATLQTLYESRLMHHETFVELLSAKLGVDINAFVKQRPSEPMEGEVGESTKKRPSPDENPQKESKKARGDTENKSKEEETKKEEGKKKDAEEDDDEEEDDEEEKDKVRKEKKGKATSPARKSKRLQGKKK